MTRDQAVAVIKNRLKRFSDSNIDADIAAEMQLVQEQVLEENGLIRPWFLLTENLSAMTTAGESRIPVPEGFLQEYEEGALWTQLTDGSWGALQKGSQEDVRLADLAGGDSGYPQAYSLDGQYFRLRPTPDASYPLQILVYQRAAPLTVGSATNAWLTHAAELLICETGIVIAEMYLQDEAAVRAFSGRLDRMMKQLQLHNEDRKHVNVRYRMGYRGAPQRP